MGVLRHFRGSISAGASWLIPAGLALLLSGCIPGPFVRSGDADSCPCAAGAPVESGTSTGQQKNNQAQEPEKEKKPSPRTLPQALCAYWHCVRTHDYLSQDQKDNEKSADEKKGSKNPTKAQEPGESPEAAPKQEKDEKKDATQKDQNGEEKNSELVASGAVADLGDRHTLPRRSIVGFGQLVRRIGV